GVEPLLQSVRARPQLFEQRTREPPLGGDVPPRRARGEPAAGEYSCCDQVECLVGKRTCAGTMRGCVSLFEAPPGPVRSEALRGAKAAGPAPRVPRHLVLREAQRPTGEDPHGGPVAARADRLLGRADAVAELPLEEALGEAVLE